MALLELLGGWWWLVLVGLAFAFFVGYVAITVYDGLRERGYKLRYSFKRGFYPVPLGDFDARTNSDGDGDFQSRANLARAVNRQPGRRAVRSSDDWPPAGRHAGGGDTVRADAEAVA